MNFQKALALVETFAVDTDEELQLLQKALSISPLPLQVAELAPILPEVQLVVGFLLKLDAKIAAITASLAALGL